MASNLFGRTLSEPQVQNSVLARNMVGVDHLRYRLTCIITRVWYQAEREQLNRFGEKQRISKQLVFMKPSHSDKPGIIKNINTGEVVAKGIDWIALPADEDSLIVYSKNNKRGYINRFSCEIAIPAKYPKAWVFSNGIAAVSEGDSVSLTTPGGLSTIRSSA